MVVSAIVDVSAVVVSVGGCRSAVVTVVSAVAGVSFLVVRI